MTDQQMYQIGEAASRAGLSFRTVRYYEEIDLVVPSSRTDGGFRLYTDDDIDRLILIRDLKPLDFSLEDLRDLLGVRDRLAETELDEAERADLTARFAGYAAAAAERCEVLRRRLGRVERVTSQLDAEAKRARKQGAARRDGAPGRPHPEQ